LGLRAPAGRAADLSSRRQAAKLAFNLLLFDGGTGVWGERMADEAPVIIEMAADIVSAYVGANALPPADLPGFIGLVHDALSGLARGEAAAPTVEAPKPAISIRKSITPDHLISLEDGRPYKSLKRHLATKYGLTPQAYREKWGLPKDYPMAAPNYAASRSALAKSMGLGQGGRSAKSATATAKKSLAKSASPTAPKPRGRPKKAV
jgi:predicted transcriptional regulator